MSVIEVGGRKDLLRHRHDITQSGHLISSEIFLALDSPRASTKRPKSNLDQGGLILASEES